MSDFISKFRSAWKIFENLEIAGFLPYKMLSAAEIKVPHLGKTWEELGSRCFAPLPENLKFLVDHDPDQVLSDGEDGRATYYHDEDGIFFRLQLPNTPLGREIYELAAKEQLGVSPAMRVFKEDSEVDRNLRPVRYVRRAELEELSLTTRPVYDESCCRSSDQERYERLKRKIPEIFFVEGVGIVDARPGPRTVFI